ncbi:hypothetical protein [Kineococcus sp. NUM-3379]
MTVLLIGAVVTLGAAGAAYLWPQSSQVSNALIMAFIGLILTVVCENRVRLHEMEATIMSSSRELAVHRDIRRRTEGSPELRAAYESTREDLDLLSQGSYRIRTLVETYSDDTRRIERMRGGEVLRSTAPVDTRSPAEALRQFSKPQYQASMRAHEAAARRGVKVHRIYLLRSRSMMTDADVAHHLRDIGRRHRNLEIRVLFRDEASLDPDSLDFLVFGDRAVSVGQLDPDTGVVNSAVVHTAPEKVYQYVRRYQMLLDASEPLPTA